MAAAGLVRRDTVRSMRSEYDQAVTKGYAIGSAGLAALVLFADYARWNPRAGDFDLSITTIIKLLSASPVSVRRDSDEASGEAAGAVVVGAQAIQNKGIMEGTAKQYGVASTC